MIKITYIDSISLPNCTDGKKFSPIYFLPPADVIGKIRVLFARHPRNFGDKGELHHELLKIAGNGHVKTKPEND
jgi:hypothetical protein